MKAGLKKSALWISALIIMAVLLLMYFIFYGSSREYDDSNRLRSTYSSQMSGTCALYITLGRLGFHVKRFKNELSELSKTNASIIIIPAIDTERPIKPSEWASLTEWVKSGNTAVIFLDSSKPLAEKNAEETAYPSFKSPLAKGVDELKVKMPSLAVMDKKKPEGKKVKTFSEKTGDYIRDALQRSIVLFKSGNEDTVWYRSMDEGNLFIIKGAWMISNEGITKGGNFCFLMNIIDRYIEPEERTGILFDEYHNGYGEDRNLWTVLPFNVKAGIVQLIIAVLLIVYTLSRRINRPVPLFDRQRTRTEYLTSMTLLFRTANATKATLNQVGDRFLSIIRKAYCLPDDASAEAVEQAIARKSAVKAREFTGIIGTVTKMGDRPDLPAREILLLSSRMSKFIAEVGKI